MKTKGKEVHMAATFGCRVALGHVNMWAGLGIARVGRSLRKGLGLRLCTTEALKLPELFDNRGHILKPCSSLDHFSTFGIERSFALDSALLAKTYKALQRQLHPDLFSLKSKEEQELSAEWSSLVNDGYKVDVQTHFVGTCNNLPSCEGATEATA